jgi:hypothetical protein
MSGIFRDFWSGVVAPNIFSTLGGTPPVTHVTLKPEDNSFAIFPIANSGRLRRCSAPSPYYKLGFDRFDGL